MTVLRRVDIEMQGIRDTATGKAYKGFEVECECGTHARIPAPQVIDLHKTKKSQVVVDGKCKTCGKILRLITWYNQELKAFQTKFDIV